MLTSRHDRRRRRSLWLVLIFFVVAALPLMFYLEERGDGGGTPRGNPGTPSSGKCPGVNLEGLGQDVEKPGEVTHAWREAIAPVYTAACRRDYARLSRLLGGGSVKNFMTDECSGCRAGDVVYMWREEYGFDGEALARVLQTRPHVDQGGLTYEDGKALAIFSRGTHDVPPQWTGFFPECRSDARCVEMADLFRRLR